MAAELMLINPRRKRRASSRRRRSGGRRKMTPLQMKYFGGGRRRASTSRRRRRRSAAVTQVLTNPRRRHRRHSRRRSVMRARRNPIRMPRLGGVTSTIVPAAVGAGGALAVNYVWNNWVYSMLPASLQSGMLSSVAKIALSLGLGVAAGMAFGKKTGNQVAMGAVTVTIASIASSYVTQAGLPGSAVYGQYYGQYGAQPAAGVAGMGARRHRMGRYVGAQMHGAPPRNLNGAPPANLNGMGRYVGRQLGRKPMAPMSLGYLGPARTVG